MSSACAIQLIEEVEAAGSQIVVVDGQARVRGRKLSADIMARLRVHRAAIVAEMEGRTLADRDRYGRLPQDGGEIPFQARDLDLPETMRAAIVAYATRQPKPVHGWILKRADEYFQFGLEQGDCDWRACVDLIAWQRNTDARTVGEWVETLTTP